MERRDVYIEHLVRKKPDAVAGLKKAGLGLAAAVLTFAVFVIEPISFMTPAAFILSIWGANKFIRLQNVEFEYIVTNGELDVDKIMGQSKRKRLITVDARSMEMLAPMDKEHEKEYTSESIKKTYDASVSKNSPNRYFAIFNNKAGLRSLLVLEYDARVIDAMKPYVQRRMQQDR